MNRLHRIITFIQSSIREVWDSLAFYDFIKNLKKTAKQQNLKKWDKSVDAIKNELFSINISIFNYFSTTLGFLFFKI